MEKKIDSGAAFMMVAIAVMVDMLQGFLTIFIIGIVVAPIISMIAGFIFWNWFNHYDAQLKAPKKMPRVLVSLGEFIPLINTLPLWTISVIIGITMHNRSAGGGL